MSDIFLSYASQDIERVRSIVAELEAQGWSVWWDRSLKPGESWPSVIERQLKRARCVVVAWSEAAVQSPWVRLEANKARERHILVPLLLEDVQIPPEFGTVQAVPLHQDHAGGAAALIDGIHALLRRRSGKRLLTATASLGLIALLIGTITCFATDACTAPVFSELPERSLAVLEFDNEIEDPQISEITSVFVDELRETLAEVEQQPVAARAPTRALPEGLTPIEIGERLRVRWLVAGTISGHSDRIELAIEMIDTSNGYLRDSRRYVSAISDLESLRQNIARDLLEMLGVTGALSTTMQTSPTQASSEAYVLYLTGKALLRQRNIDDAETSFQRAQALESGYPEADAGLCRVYLSRFENSRNASDFETAEIHCIQALTSARRSSDAGLALGELYLQRGDMERAQNSFARALTLNTSSAEANIGLARVAEADNRVSEAEQYLREGIVAQRGYWRPYNELGIFLLGQGRTEDALLSFDEALALAPNDSAILNNLAVTYVMIEEFDRAVEAWSRVLEVAPDAAAYGNLGSAYYWSGRLEEAVAMYREAVRLHPQDFRWWSSLGDAQLHLEQEDAALSFEQALERTDEELRINPDNADVRVGRSAILAALGRSEEAQHILEQHRKAISLNPEFAYIAAVAAVRLGDDNAALGYLDTAVTLGYPDVLIQADPTFREIRDGPVSRD